MRGVTRLGDLNSGHDACPPIGLSVASADVLVNGLGGGRLGDVYGVHGCKDHGSHVGSIATASTTVLVNGRGLARIGDSVSCGGSAMQGSSDVLVGG